jgi:hypothetical protein
MGGGELGRERDEVKGTGRKKIREGNERNQMVGEG